MFESYDTQKRRKAIALAVEEKLTPSHVARVLNYTARAVRLWVQEYRTLHPAGHAPETSYAPVEVISASPSQRPEPPTNTFSFAPVVLDTLPSPDSQPVSLDIVTPTGHAVRLCVRSVEEAAELIRHLEKIDAEPTSEHFHSSLLPTGQHELVFQRSHFHRQEYFSRRPEKRDAFSFFQSFSQQSQNALWDNDGFAIWYKRLEKGTFRLPPRLSNDAAVHVTRAQLAMILEGIGLLPGRRRQRYPDIDGIS